MAAVGRTTTSCRIGGGDAGMLAELAVIDRFHLSRLGRFLGDAAFDAGGDGAMLDRTMVALRQRDEFRQRGRALAEKSAAAGGGGAEAGSGAWAASGV